MNPREELRRKLEELDAVVGVVGLGYVGARVGLCFARAGFRVLGFDIDSERVARLGRGEDDFLVEAEAGLVELTANRFLTVTSDFSRLREADAILVCVPTPLCSAGEPDLTQLVSACDSLSRNLRRGQLIVLESTTYPGTTKDLFLPALEKSDLECGRDYFLAYSPQRQNIGNPEHAMDRIPKVLGAIDPASLAMAKLLYNRVVPEIVEVSSCCVAETVKLVENIFRAVNISLVNELKIILDRVNIDVWEVLDAAETKPFGFMRFDPGPGWGGHCIPVDPIYFNWIAGKTGGVSRLIEASREVNELVPSFVLQKLETALSKNGTHFRESRLLVLGIAYKRDVSDVRRSPALPIIQGLLERGARVAFHDPLVRNLPEGDLKGVDHCVTWVPLELNTVKGYDALIIVTDHSGLDYQMLAERSELVIDCRGVLRDSRLPHVIQA